MISSLRFGLKDRGNRSGKTNRAPTSDKNLIFRPREAGGLTARKLPGAVSRNWAGAGRRARGGKPAWAWGKRWVNFSEEFLGSRNL
jgi:hypothetical protein